MGQSLPGQRLWAVSLLLWREPASSFLMRKGLECGFALSESGALISEVLQPSSPRFY
jgi:hypothetical protein